MKGLRFGGDAAVRLMGRLKAVSTVRYTVSGCCLRNCLYWQPAAAFCVQQFALKLRRDTSTEHWISYIAYK